MERSLLDNAVSILMGVVVLYSFFLSFKPALQSLKSVAGAIKIKPNTRLQSLPKIVTTVTLLLVIFAIFNIGTYEQGFKYDLPIRLVAFALFTVSIVLQIRSFKDLGPFYSQDIVLFSKHKIVTTGTYKYLRHPSYFFQFISTLSAALALESYVILIFFLFAELPILIMRADFEEEFLLKHMEREYQQYSQSTLKWIPYPLSKHEGTD